MMNQFINKPLAFLLLLAAMTSLYCVEAQNTTEPIYQRPPEVMANLIEAPTTPAISVDSKGEWMLLMERPGNPSIEEVAAPELRIGGLRINPANNGRSRVASISSLVLHHIPSGQQHQITDLPEKPRINYPSWSPDEQKIAFTNATDDTIELWVLDIETKKAQKLFSRSLNDAYFGSPFTWMSDGKTILAKVIPEDRGNMPQPARAPSGPTIQENLGESAPSRTYQDLLKSPYDEALFTYMLTSELMKINTSGVETFTGIKGTIRSFDPSPDGNYILVETFSQPYSYLVPSYYFPYNVSVYTNEGSLVKEIANIPLAEKIPVGFDAVIDAPRGHNWRPDASATLYWYAALDEGNPRKEVEVRDELLSWAAPFTGTPTSLAKTSLRMRGVDWSEKGFAIVYERWWKNRAEKRWQIPTAAAGNPQLLVDRSYEDRYSDPGNPVSKKGKYGRDVLLTNRKGDGIFMFAAGASDEGNRPFVSTFNLKTKENKILWRSTAPYYERPVSLINADQGTFVISRESETIQPNYFLKSWKNAQEKQITSFPHPYPELEGIQKEYLKYEREDGIPLTATLYLPKDYDTSKGTLPMLMWAYPREFKDAAAAGQVKNSPYEFTRVSWRSVVFWATQGYAVLDNTDFPIVGEGDNEPNDTYVEQLIANAKAAIEEMKDRGISDGKRVGVGGHSYGAFMTANLLSNSDLFSAGIARSGAYNRTLTPFGFQREERTYWQAPDVYNKMSPFMAADRMKTPLLLIHGEADNNSGTFPIQSERYYNALKGHGATTRLVFLPHESHGYSARESVLHMLWEMHEWLEKYVKNAE